MATSPTSPAQPGVPPNLTLRERKKMLVMETIQRTALDLFDERGFGNVTIEEVAAAAGVSPSTVYRLFGSKDRLVTYDEFDRLMVEGFLGHLATMAPLAAARATLVDLTPVINAGGNEITRRLRYMAQEPSVMAALAAETVTSGTYLGQLIAQSPGAPADATQAALIGPILAVTLVTALQLWYQGGCAESYAQVVARCLDLLESGLQA
ncbi:MAG: TetR/AcrR family transcriptional regulator [Bifidobacteriaceae bacterium]|jgi:AcrR family transcriptional regulator|nr:TetR/AcrR family transcriptional regulator [Bifidobacteriaceae bacterium]